MTTLLEVKAALKTASENRTWLWGEFKTKGASRESVHNARLHDAIESQWMAVEGLQQLLDEASGLMRIAADRLNELDEVGNTGAIQLAATMRSLCGQLP